MTDGAARFGRRKAGSAPVRRAVKIHAGTPAEAMLEKWKNYRWHHQVPPGFKSVPEVFEILGRVIFDAERWADGWEQWTSTEGRHPDSLPSAEARRHNDVIDWMHRLAAAGLLKFHMQTPSGRPLVVDPSRWNCPAEVAKDRFYACAMNSMEGYKMLRPTNELELADYAKRFDIPIFADDASLMRAAQGIRVEPHRPGRSHETDITVHIADSFMDRFAGQISAAVENSDGSLTTLRSARTGAAGRPTSMHIIRQLFKERCASGEVDLSSLSAEAAALLQKFSADPSNADLPQPTVGTIRNNLRDHYRAEKARFEA